MHVASYYYNYRRYRSNVAASTTYGGSVQPITPEKGNDSKKRKLTDPIPGKTKPKGSSGEARFRQLVVR